MCLRTQETTCSVVILIILIILVHLATLVH